MRVNQPYKADVRPPKDGWAPGTYISHCLTCENTFVGDKRAVTCADCAYGEALIAILANAVYINHGGETSCKVLHDYAWKSVVLFPDSTIRTISQRRLKRVTQDHK